EVVMTTDLSKSRPKHTPGPWYVEAEIGDEAVTYNMIVEYDEEEGETDETIDRAEVRATCYLIAAAPEMLTALEIVLQSLINELLDQDYTEEQIEAQLDIKVARAAIATARGLA